MKINIQGFYQYIDVMCLRKAHPNWYWVWIGLQKIGQKFFSPVSVFLGIDMWQTDNLRRFKSRKIWNAIKNSLLTKNWFSRTHMFRL
jgi:hypothetical protein